MGNEPAKDWNGGKGFGEREGDVEGWVMAMGGSDEPAIGEKECMAVESGCGVVVDQGEDEGRCRRGRGAG